MRKGAKEKLFERACASVRRKYRNSSNSHRGQFYSESTASRIRTDCNKMTPIIVNYIGTTRKVVFMKDLSNKPYPSPVNLLITSPEAKKGFH